MLSRRFFVWLVSVGWLLMGAGPAVAAGRVELVVIGESQVGGEFHQWVEALNKVGAARVQIRSAQPSDKIAVEVRGTAEQPIYVVTAMLRGNELVMPGGRFTRGDQEGIARWIADLAENGPVENRETQSAFGLPASQMAAAKADLAQKLTAATAGASRADVVQRIAAQLKNPLRIDPAALASLREDKISEELSPLTCGTALAYVVRSAGLAMTPVRAGAGLSYLVLPARPGQEVWPVGWKSEKPPKDALPILFEFLNVNIKGVSAARALEAIGQRLKVPLLLDHNALARHGIEPDKVTVSLPQARSTYSLTLQKVLFQARLKLEVRVDEAGSPLLWITTIKPM